MRAITCKSLLALLLVSGGAAADSFEQARELLERMAASMRDLSYQGTFVYVRGEDVETMRITHVSDAQGVRERLYAVSGPPREVIRDASGVRCSLGQGGPQEAQALLSRSPFPDIPVQELTEARGRYLFEVGGSARIAGFEGLRLTILPRDEFRYGYDLWLEQDSGLLLRWVLYDGDRRTLAKLMFTDLAIGAAVDAAELESPTPMEQFVRLEPDRDSAAATIAEGAEPPQGLPPGFRLAARSSGAGDGGYEHLVFSDGLASVSVYIEPSEAAGGMTQGLSRMGTANAYSRPAAGRQVTAIGEVPPVTVKAISNAFATDLGQ